MKRKKEEEENKEEHNKKVRVEVEKEMEMCVEFGETPCLWQEIQQIVIDETEEEEQKNITCGSFNKVRKTAYAIYTREHLGLGNREQVPNCALVGIRTLWPDEKGSYMGFKEV